MYGPIKKVAKKSGYTENNGKPNGLTADQEKNLPPELKNAIKEKKGFMRYADGSMPTEMPAPIPRFCGGKSKPFKK